MDLLAGEARFICNRDGLSVLTNSIRFLSEIFPLSLDPRGVAEEMSRFIPERYKTQTPWAGVRRVPPGFKAYLRRDNSWDITPISAASSKFASADRTTLHGGELQRVLRSAVRRSINGASSVVADLSGGMDSTSICAILSELGEPYVPTHVASSDNNNLDKHYAEIAAAALGQSICTLGDSRVAAGAFDSTFHGSPAALDEGIPTWVGGDKGYARRSRFASTGGHDLYLVGVGGDELFSMQYGSLLASDGAAGGLRRYRTLLRSMSAAGTLRANARMLMTRLLSPGDEAKARLGSVDKASTNPGDALADLGWMPGLEVPSYLASSLRAELCANIIDFANSEEFFLHEERFKHVIFESIMKQAKTLASVNRNFGHSKLQFKAPFLDAELVTQVLALDSHEFSPRNGHKHILKKVVGDSLPAAIRDRPDKGELSSELYESFAANRDTVRRHLGNSYLVDLGVVDGDSLRTVMSRSMYSTGSLMELEELYHAEKWVRAMDSKVGSCS
ncbi:asparagine synthase (glutamine-hydrolyzing) [Arthrobacter sp. UYCu712]